MPQPDITAFFDKLTSTLSYVLSDPETGACAVIDPLLGYDAASGHTNSTGAEEIATFVESRGLTCVWLLETHVHADHLSGAAWLKNRLGGRIGICSGVCAVQQNFVRIFDLADEVATDGSQFDHLFVDGEGFEIGNLRGQVIATPGHTPSCVSYLVDGNVFVGDLLFMPDFGTARCDFPGGSARELYNSVQKVLALPDETNIYTCHDYQPGGRELRYQATVAEQKASNLHIGGDATADGFVAMRESRDSTLAMPGLIIPAIQVNIRAGNLPDPAGNGTSYLRVPLNIL